MRGVLAAAAAVTLAACAAQTGAAVSGSDGSPNDAAPVSAPMAPLSATSSQASSGQAPVGFSSEWVLASAVASAEKPSTSYSPCIAFSLGGQVFHTRWPHATVSYHAGQSPLPASQRQILEDDVGRINADIGAEVYRYVGDQAPADVVVTDSAALPEGVLGLTRTTVAGVQTDASVTLGMSQLVSLRPGLTNALFQKVALHELGHTAGLDHDPDPQGLMYAQTGSDSPTDFIASERASLRLLYGLPDAPATAGRAVAALRRPFELVID